MKKSLLLTSVLAAGLLITSCSSETVTEPDMANLESANTLSFTLRMPGGEKVSYTRADDNMIHDASEYSINNLALYEYRIEGENETLVRVIKSNGKGKNVLDLTDKNSDNSYNISITVPSEYIGKEFRYRFVANESVADPEVDSPFSDFLVTKVTRELLDGNSADALSSNGIVMSGVAKNGSTDVITIAEETKCTVEMVRIVSRIDIKYETPNLRLTSVSLRNAPKSGYIFAQEALPTIESGDCLTLLPRTDLTFPDFIKDMEAEEGENKTEKVELEKVFYLYERANSETASAMVHIEYEVDYNNKVDDEGNRVYYHGSIDVPFAKADGSFVDAIRNHRYTIVLGNGKEPVAGEIKFNIIVNDWIDVAIDDEFTSDDPEVTSGEENN
ncbi:MAG: hypothetical protein K2M93_08260 [Muribaculaceae bacterium]|nr:hypothetical protein [Muribaculaceae bacterium]